MIDPRIEAWGKRGKRFTRKELKEKKAELASLESRALPDLLNRAARCLDDCLMQIYPEEFTSKDKEAAGERFSKAGGTIYRVASLSDELRGETNGKDGKNAESNIQDHASAGG